MADIVKKTRKYIGKTIFRYQMIQPGDRILLCISGGKDSLAMLYDFAQRNRNLPIPFEFEAVHVVSDLAESHHKKELARLMSDWNVKHHFIDLSLSQRQVAGKPINCYWCATQRRIEIFKLAEKQHFNKIALGHHMDDVIETFLLNIFYKSEVATMLPVMSYKKFPLTIIRPLYHIPEKTVLQFFNQLKLNVLSPQCHLKEVTKRKLMKDLIGQLARDNDSIRRNIMSAMKNIQHEYLPE